MLTIKVTTTTITVIILILSKIYFKNKSYYKNKSKIYYNYKNNNKKIKFNLIII